jgi:Ca2+-binding EF-hand superfamily protein
MIVTTVALAGLLSMAVASDPSPELFGVLDANQDGLIASSEVTGSQRIWFTRALRVADTDGDERLTQKELDRALTDPEPRSAPAGRFGGRRRPPNPQQLDRNNDGMITVDEVPGRGKQRFQEMLTRTGQDSISVDNMTRMMGRERGSRSQGLKSSDRKAAEMKDSGEKEADKRPGRQRKGNQKTGQGQPRRSRLFDRFDKNKDGRMTRDESPERLRSSFDRLDTNGDGVLTPPELQAAAKRREQRSKRKK